MHGRGELSEEALIAGVLEGSEASFRALYAQHTPALFRTAMRLAGGREADSEDLVQETWLRAVRGLSRFERRSTLRTWLTAIVTRCAAERYRKGEREVTDEAVTVPVSARGDGAPTRIDIERAFVALPFGFRTVLVLHDVEGFRHNDIADLLDISPGTSKSQLSRARARMRDLLGADYAQP